MFPVDNSDNFCESVSPFGGFFLLVKNFLLLEGKMREHFLLYFAFSYLPSFP